MASDYLLELEGIKGESLDEKHKDKIEIDSFSWGVSNDGNMGRGGGGGTGKANFQDVHFTKQTDKSSALLVKSAASGDHIKKAVLTARKAGGKAGQAGNPHQPRAGRKSLERHAQTRLKTRSHTP